MIESQGSVHSKDSIADWLVQWIAKELGLPTGEIETEKSLLDYSLSSVTAMMLVGDLEEWLGLTLPPTLVWDYPSIAAIADYLTQELGSQGAATNHGDSVAGQVDRAAEVGYSAESLAAVDGLSDQEVTALLNKLMADENAGASL